MTTHHELKLYDKNVVLDYIKKTTKIIHRGKKTPENRQGGSHCKHISRLSNYLNVLQKRMIKVTNSVTFYTLRRFEYSISYMLLPKVRKSYLSLTISILLL